MVISDDEINSLKLNKEFMYSSCLVFINENLKPDSLQNLDERVIPSRDEAIIIENGKGPKPIEYYINDDGKKIILNIYDYESYIEDISDYYVLNNHELPEKADEVIDKIKRGEVSLGEYY